VRISPSYFGVRVGFMKDLRENREETERLAER